MNVIGRQSWHTTSARTPRNNGLQHERLFQMPHVRPVERPVDLATIRTGKGVALRGNEWRNERDTKVRKRIIRHTDATIITATWRADSTRTSCPRSRRSIMVRRADSTSPLPRVYRSLITNRILSWADEPTPRGATPNYGHENTATSPFADGTNPNSPCKTSQRVAQKVVTTKLVLSISLS